MTKLRLRGFQDGVGECMEGQIGGKSGPGVLRTRQSGDLGAWGEAWEGPGGEGGKNRCSGKFGQWSGKFGRDESDPGCHGGGVREGGKQRN